MVQITAADGTVMDISDDNITLVAGPRPHDPPHRTYISGIGAAAIVTNEDTAAFLARIHPAKPLQRFTRPNDTGVWIKCGAVTAVLQPTPDDIPPGETVGAVIYLGGQHQAVEEDVDAVRAVVNTHGGHV
jgi:hypothetical protein